jgi:hypothetical protein
MTKTTEAPPEQTDVLVERLFAATIDALEIASVHVGGQLGFYRALADGGDATPADLAGRTGTAERYVREWLEQQAVAGFLSVDDPDAGAGERRYGLPAAYRPVFVDEEDLNHLTPLATLAIGVCGPMGALLEAYRTGAGCPTRPMKFTRRSARSTNRSSSTSSPAGSPGSRSSTGFRLLAWFERLAGGGGPSPRLQPLMFVGCPAADDRTWRWDRDGQR